MEFHCYKDSYGSVAIVVLGLSTFAFSLGPATFLLPSFLPFPPRSPGTIVSSQTVLVVAVTAGSLPLSPHRSDIYRVGSLLLRLRSCCDWSWCRGGDGGGLGLSETAGVLSICVLRWSGGLGPTVTFSGRRGRDG